MEKLKTIIIGLHDSVKKLNELYPQKKITLDGRLVGDIGEIIAKEIYDIELHDKVLPHYDALAKYVEPNLNIQIKATFKESLTYNHTPNYYIGIKINEEGDYHVIYNGPGKYIFEEFKHRKDIGVKLLSFPIKRLEEISKTIPEHERIKKR